MVEIYWRKTLAVSDWNEREHERNILTSSARSHGGFPVIEVFYPKSRMFSGFPFLVMVTRSENAQSIRIDNESVASKAASSMGKWRHSARVEQLGFTRRPRGGPRGPEGL
jgi:hypothetical protein